MTLCSESFKCFIDDLFCLFQLLNEMSSLKSDYEEKYFSWEPKELFEGQNDDYVFLILNTKILDELKVIKLWNNAKFKVTVDGGTNRWHKIAQKYENLIQEPRPNLITGDLDSIDKNVLDYYRNKTDSYTKVIQTVDQNYTDFTKALFEIDKLGINSKAILAFAEHSGRLDQIFGIFETLFHVQGNPVFVISSTSIEWLLGPGNHTIHLPQ